MVPTYSTAITASPLLGRSHTVRRIPLLDGSPETPRSAAQLRRSAVAV